MKVLFTVPGEPRGKGRPRFARCGEGVRTYTPQVTECYENLVKSEYIRQCKNTYFDKDKMLRMTIYASFTIPKSASRKKRERMLNGVILPTKKPDIDNIFKIIADSLNGIAYHDDSQIVIASAHKLYSENPGVTAVIQTIGG